MTAGQVVDTSTAAEFLGQVLELTTREELAGIAEEVAAKSAAMRTIAGDDLAALGADALRELLGWVFCARRHVDKVLAVVDAGDLARGIADLVDGTDRLPLRFDRFSNLLAGCAQVSADLPAELMHFLDPARYWLWSRWMWDPETETGSLRLVTMDEVDLDGDTRGEVYLRVGRALAFVSETGHAAGFTSFAHRGDGQDVLYAEAFSTDVFLAAVYGVYMQTVLRMRLTQEFTNLVPPLPQLTRRLLGVHRPTGQEGLTMPAGGRKISPTAVEFDLAEVASTISGRTVELPGMWNRMFESRVLTDSGPEGFDELATLPGAESLEWCYGCGKCEPVCPVNVVSEYGPRKLHRLVQTGGDLIASDELWMCTTCGNCLRVCPKEVDMIQMMPAVREEAISRGHVPAELQTVFEATFRQGNALGANPRRRAAWTKEAGVPVRELPKDPSPVDVLFYVEDYWSYHPRGMQAAQAFARVMTALGIDFAILGAEEKTLGDSQRLAGERGLFESLMEDVTATLAKYSFTRIVTPDPHGFNALKKEYPKHGHTYDALHYTQLLAPLVDQLQFTGRIDAKVTFHDPCYLGRHNGEYDAPRTLLTAIPGVELVEMGRCKENGYCCGGGGGGMWLDGFNSDKVEERLSERRVREAAESGADILAVCCPYEVSRFSDAAKSTGNEQLQVLDIAEMLDTALGSPRTA